MTEPSKKNGNHHETDAWIRSVDRELRKCSQQQFFGRVTVEFVRGNITRVEVVKSVKDPNLLEDPAQNRVAPVAGEG